ncbi:MAG: hypothetical protein ACREHF_04490 [Rhizomicrobium sp.]
MRKLIGALLALALVGCASSGTKVDPARVQAFQKGKTTYTEVLTALGAPQADAVADDGSRTVTYTYTQAQARAIDFVPVVGSLAGGADAKVSGYVFKFDTAGILVSYSAVTGHNSVNTGLFNSN